MHGIWRDMFVITLPILEKILRPVIVYFFLVVMLRLSGKRELVQLNPFDLVVLLTLLLGMIIRSREGCWERLPFWR